jgi:Tol biopolymer transport system component
MGVPESGGRPQVLYDGPLSELDPDWSPDGRQLVYATRINNAGVVSERGLDVLDVGTGTVRTLLRLPNDFTRYPAWSPTGREIAYATSLGGNGPQTAARIVGADGTGDRLLAVLPDPGFAIQDLSWQPDGSRIWVSATNPSTFDWRLWSVDARTGAVRLEDDRFRLGYPRFFEHLPLAVVEGDEIGADGLSHSSLYLTDRRTLAPRVRIFPVADDQWSPALSPDGDRVAYLRPGTHPTKPHALEVISLTGRVRQLVAPLPGVDTFYREGLSWQPEGRCVVGFDYRRR